MAVSGVGRYVCMYVCVCVTVRSTVKFLLSAATSLHSTKMAVAREPFEFSLRSASSEHYISSETKAVLPCPSSLIYAAKSEKQTTIVVAGLFAAVSDQSVKRG